MALALLASAPAAKVATIQAAPPPPVVTVPAGAQCPEWWFLAAEAGWPADELPTVDRVMWCESRCEPAAYNRSGATGLMQVMPMWHHGRDATDPATNLAIALEVFRLQGWRAWSCYP